MKTPIKTREEIEEMSELAETRAEDPKNHGMTYEQGVAAALEWVLGEIEDDEGIL